MRTPKVVLYSSIPFPGTSKGESRMTSRSFRVGGLFTGPVHPSSVFSDTGYRIPSSVVQLHQLFRCLVKPKPEEPLFLYNLREGSADKARVV